MAIPSYRIYPYFKNNRFSNYPGEKYESILRSAFMLVESLLQQKKGLKELKRHWVLQKPVFLSTALHTDPQPIITWVGHATFIIQISGLVIATDPIFGNPSSFFKRITKPGIQLEHLPAVDVVLLSHNHLDHMHYPSLWAIAKKNPRVRFLVPLGDKAGMQKQGFTHVEEYTWWDAVEIFGTTNESIKFSFLPALHWSGRGVFDRNKSLWGSWMIQSSAHTLYFAGDTAYGKHFKAIAEEFPVIDTALMPIGPCEPSEDTQLTHMGPEQAGQAFLDLQARCFIPMHWGVYWFGIDYPLLPMERLQAWWQGNLENLEGRTLAAMKFGESLASKSTTLSSNRNLLPLQNCL